MSELGSSESASLANLAATMSEANFYKKDDLTYTEDHVLVYNIFAYHVPRKAKEHDLYKYFSRYGSVKKVAFHLSKRRARRYAPKVGYVHFKDPKSAAKALDVCQHVILGTTVSVKACDSWYQPESEELASETVEFWSLSLLDLNDDCLEHIFKCLALKDQINFTRTCKRFGAIFQMRSKIDYKSFDLSRFSSLTLWEIRVFLMMAGGVIEELYGTLAEKCRDRIVKFIGQFCTNLRIFKMSGVQMRTAWLYRWLCALKTIVELHLEQCKVNDNAIRGLTSLPQLRKLNIRDNGNITGKFLPLLRHIVDLDLSGCNNLRPEHLILTFISMEFLKVLNIQDCDGATSSVYHTISVYSKCLERLKISATDEMYVHVASIKKLQYLEIFTGRMNTTLEREFLEQLVLRKAHQLQVLKIVGMFHISLQDAQMIGRMYNLRVFACICIETLTDAHLAAFANMTHLESINLSMAHRLTAGGLVRMIKRLPYLESLEVIRCNQLNESFILLVINLLANRKQPPNKPLLINVSGTQIEPSFLENERFVAAQHLVRLSFTEPIDIIAQIAPLGVHQVIYHMMQEADEENDEDGNAHPELHHVGPINLEGLNEINPNVDVHIHINVPALAEIDEDEMYFGFNIFGRFVMFERDQVEQP